MPAGKVLLVADGKGKRKSKRQIKKYFKKKSRKIPPAFHSHKYCKMTYNGSFTVTSSSGVPGSYLWSQNSVFDPDDTSLGHQPYFYDQLSAIYKAYVVTGCKIELTGSASSNCMVTLRPVTSNATPANLMLEGERPNVKIGYFSNYNQRKLTNYISTARLFGRSKDAITDEDDFRGSAGNPTQRGYWSICVQHPDQASTVSLYANVKITYYVKWMNLSLLAQS